MANYGTCEWLHATDAEEVAHNLLLEARADLTKLQNWLEEMAKAMDRHVTDKYVTGIHAFDVYWGVTADERLSNIMNNIARANGAVLVRGTERENANINNA